MISCIGTDDGIYLIAKQSNQANTSTCIVHLNVLIVSCISSSGCVLITEMETFSVRGCLRNFFLFLFF